MTTSTNGEERILVCLSTSPSNIKVINAAVKMSKAFNATLTAIYIKPTNSEAISETDRLRLQNNINYAEQNGASVTTVIGDNIPVLIAEFAHISGTTKIVIGRSGSGSHHFWNKISLTEQITISAPSVDVYIIPDSVAELKIQNLKKNITSQIKPTIKDAIITTLLLLASTCIGVLLNMLGFSEANIIMAFLLGVLIISVTTVSPLYSVLSSLISVLLFNWFFIEPKFSFHTYEPEYLVTFAIMLTSSLITDTLANKLKANARHSAREAFRAKVLFDTNQLLQKADNADNVLKITAKQAITLLDRDVTIYSIDGNNNINQSIRFNSLNLQGNTNLPENEKSEIIHWVFNNRKPAGLHFDDYSDEKSQYYPIGINSHCYGVISLHLNGKTPEAFECSVLMSILGECALALESLRNAAEKEQASVIARNEQLRSNLLRSISHDIRTPLTSISGNASNLIYHYKHLDDATLEYIFSDIYSDSEWLIDLVENLLSISRIENGQMELHLTTEIMNDVIDEAMKHIDKNASLHNITVTNSDELLLAKMDSRLIMQVLINLINNAIKNTQTGSEIHIENCQIDDNIVVTVSDNGPGISDDNKAHIFEMFFIGNNKIADGRRGLGLGLALCKSIIDAHNGTITLSDNTPHGCIFTFTLPAERIEINE